MKVNLKESEQKLFYVIFDVMSKKMVLFLIASVLLISGCREESFSVSGTVEGAGEGEYLLLREVKPGFLEPVDSVVPGKDGRFSFRSETEWPAFYMLSLDDDDFLTLLVSPGEKIEVHAERGSMAKPQQVTGSEGTSHDHCNSGRITMRLWLNLNTLLTYTTTVSTVPRCHC